jgi:hypothetical protein
VALPASRKSRSRIAVETAVHDIPHRQASLSFVDEHRAFSPIHPTRIGGEQFPGSWIVQSNTMRARRLAVSILPAPFGPSTAIAGKLVRSSSNSSSTTRGR